MPDTARHIITALGLAAAAAVPVGILLMWVVGTTIALVSTVIGLIDHEVGEEGRAAGLRVIRLAPRPRLWVSGPREPPGG